MLYVIVKALLGPLILLLFRTRVYGRENLRVDGPAIFVANHLALFDPVMIALISPRLVHFMAKKELFQSWIGKVFFKLLLAFPVNRHTADLASLKQAMDVLNKGKVFGIFPEGKRSVTGELDEFEKGTAFLALRSGAPVIPIFIASDSYSKFRFRAIVGERINTDNLSRNRAEAIEELTLRISDAITSLRMELEAEK